MDNIDFEAALKERQPGEEVLVPEVMEPALPAVVEFDPAFFAAQLVPFEKKLDLYVQRARDLVVEDGDSRVVAVEVVAVCKKAAKAIEVFRKEVEKPHRDYISTVNNLAKRLTERAAEAIRISDGKISAYNYKVTMERNVAEAKAKEEARKLQEALNLEAQQESEATGEVVEAPIVATPVMSDKKEIVRTAEGSVSQRSHWKAELEDETKVDREYLEINWTKVNQAVKAGIRHINGFIIKEETINVYR